MSTIYLPSYDPPDGFGEFDDEFHPLFSDEEIEAMERRRDKEREEKEKLNNQ